MTDILITRSWCTDYKSQWNCEIWGPAASSLGVMQEYLGELFCCVNQAVKWEGRTWLRLEAVNALGHSGMPLCSICWATATAAALMPTQAQWMGSIRTERVSFMPVSPTFWLARVFGLIHQRLTEGCTSPWQTGGECVRWDHSLPWASWYACCK